jgi:hypothetical protein
MDEFHSPLLTLIYNKYIRGCSKIFIWVMGVMEEFMEAFLC